MTYRYFIGEFVGTYILSSCLNFMADYKNNQKVELIQIVIGMLVAALMTKKLSNADLNPGVTFLYYLNKTEEERKKSIDIVKQLLLGQILGGILSPLLALIMIGNTVDIKISEQASYFTGFLFEFIACTMFYSVILFQSKAEFNLHSGDDVVSIAICMMGMAAAISIAGNQSGAGLNPAISLSQNIFTFIKSGKLQSFSYSPIYVCAPLCGSYCANLYFNYFREESIVNNEKFANKI